MKITNYEVLHLEFSAAQLIGGLIYSPQVTVLDNLIYMCTSSA